MILELGWQPLPSLRTWASYRYDDRQVELAPDVQSELGEVGAAFAMGLLEMGVVYTDSFSRPEGVAGRHSRSIRWFIARRFGGLLPIVSAPKRRGEIR